MGIGRNLPDNDPNHALVARGDFNSSDDDDQDNLDFAASERGFNRNDEATFLPGSQENHGQDGDQYVPTAGVAGE
ncbi:MAG TPA: hypothetical protein VLN58_02180 [Verrucomicrobiae bacterium]|nr:hypothetical protein [Verrucomicrobiae bacterium]